MFDIGYRIKELRKLNKMTSTELSSKLGLSQAQLSRIENNVNIATFDTVYKICSLLGISLSEFFNDNYKPTSLTPELKELLQSSKNLTPEQLEHLTNFIKTLK